MYSSVWEVQGFDWDITTRLVVIPQWLVVIPSEKNSKLYNQLLKNVLTQLWWLRSKANMKAGIQASYITLHS